MRCLLLSVTRNRRGESVRDGRVIEAAVLRIGRNSAFEVHLPDARVRLHHASLVADGQGRLLLEVHGEPITFEGQQTRQVHLRPGLTFLIGPYICTVELPINDGFEAHDFVFSIEKSAPKPGVRVLQVERPTSLAAAGFRPWRAACLASVLAALCCLVVPRLADLMPRAAALSAQVPLARTLATSWSPGLFASGHRGFGNDCEHCHVLPFSAVADNQCIACHADARAHISQPVLAQEAGVTTCASCHRDHRGAAGMQQIKADLCSDCHADLHQRVPSAKLVEVGDFAHNHPAFELQVVNAGAASAHWISQTGPTQAVGELGLKFPHDVHLRAEGLAAPLVKAGQVTRASSQGTRVVLRCVDCHLPSASGVGFETVRMQSACSQCHRLEFQPGSERQLPHGSAAEVMTTLRDFYAALALGAETVRPPGDSGMERQVPASLPLALRVPSTLTDAQRATLAAAKEVFTVRVCVTCHVVTPTGTAALPYQIAPVANLQHWMPQANFEHQRHAAVACTECHAVTRLHDANVVAMPTLTTCRHCHAGNQAVLGQVTSGCTLCHDYHRHTDAQSALMATASSTAFALAARPVKVGAKSQIPLEAR